MLSSPDGWPASRHGSRAVLEVGSCEVQLILGEGQTTGRLVHEKMTEAPEHVYGADLKSHCQAQGLKLSRHFTAG